MLNEVLTWTICTVVGDGAFGYEPNAPYDRLISTAAVRTIPNLWVKQTRPGGRVLLPWANSFADALVALSVDERGHATGTIVTAAHQWWMDHGKPGPERWRFTVAPDGQRIELASS